VHIVIFSLATNAKTQNGELKGKVALLRLRLYNTLLCLPPAAYEGCLSGVLRELVGEITLTNNMSSTVSSLMTQVCEVEFSSIVDISSCDTDYLMLEQQLRPFSASGAEAIEHDPLVLLEESHVSFVLVASGLGLFVLVCSFQVVVSSKLFIYPLTCNHSSWQVRYPVY
jgi:hypothetical protein